MSASRLELVIFDCDGVLVDSEPIINRAHASVLTACGYSITARELVERFCGMSDPEMLAVIERDWGRALPASYGERVGAMIENGFRRSLRAIEGVTEVLYWLQLTVCVASSSAPEQIRGKLQLTGLLRHFGENLFSATMVARGKAGAGSVPLCRTAPCDGAGALPRYRGQSGWHRCRRRRRNERDRLLRRKPLRVGAQGSSARPWGGVCD